MNIVAICRCEVAKLRTPEFGSSSAEQTYKPDHVTAGVTAFHSSRSTFNVTNNKTVERCFILGDDPDRMFSR